MYIFKNTKSDNRHPPYYFGRGNSSASLLRLEDGPLLPDVSKEPIVFIFKVTKQSRSQNAEVEGGRLLRNVGKQPNPRHNDLLSR